MNNKIIAGIIGWYGTTAILLAYALLSFDTIESNNIIYQILNITGALALVFHSFRIKDYPPGVLNVVWATIAIITLIQG